LRSLPSCVDEAASSVLEPGDEDDIEIEDDGDEA
jgi:hypothetical protein